MMLPVIKLRAVWFTISGILIAASVAALVLWGLKFGIDFTGGTIQELEWHVVRPTNDDIAAVFKEQEIEQVLIQSSGTDRSLIRYKEIEETKHQQVTNALRKKFVAEGVEEEKVLDEKSYSSVGPTIGNELQRKSIYAIVMVLVAIILYISYAFRRVSRPVSSWKYGIAAIVALLHDVFIPVGFFSVFGRFLGYEIDILFVTALLTVLGFSVHDTIVVFDRIRENLLKKEGSFEDIVNFSVNQTFVRSLNTSFTVLLVLLGVYFFGGASTRQFVLTLVIGVFFGTYSSIFVASPLLVVWQRWSERRR